MKADDQNVQVNGQVDNTDTSQQLRQLTVSDRLGIALHIRQSLRDAARGLEPVSRSVNAATSQAEPLGATFVAELRIADVQSLLTQLNDAIVESRSLVGRTMLADVPADIVLDAVQK